MSDNLFNENEGADEDIYWILTLFLSVAGVIGINYWISSL